MFERLTVRIAFIVSATLVGIAVACAVVALLAYRAALSDTAVVLRSVASDLADRTVVRLDALAGGDPASAPAAAFADLREASAPLAAVGIAAIRLVDAEGRDLLRTGDPALGPAGPLATPADPPGDPAVRILHGGSVFDGTRWLAARRDLPGHGLTLVVVADWSAVRRHVASHAVWMGLFALPAMIAFVLVTLLALRRASQAQASARRAAEEMDRRMTVEARLRQTQKMEALGLLTGGVAHDFNNLLTAIQGNLRILRRECPPDMAERLDSIGLAVQRGERLARQLLTFGRPQAVQRTLLDVNDVVHQILPLIERTVSAAIEVRIALTTRPCPVEAERAGLELSILNLVANARDAMPDGGCVTILTERVPRGPDGAPQILLGISDTGVGMPQAVQERVFEPFFTTKEVGKGTGLGLSAVYGFVRQAGGTIHIESAPGLGTTVSLLLPETERREAPAPTVSLPPERPGLAPLQARGLVLVVEDDALVRMVTVDGLREAGLEVIVAEDAPEALRVLEETGAALDAVVTDVVMPRGMSGIDLARVVRQRWPDLALVVTTGYSATDIPLADLPDRHAVLMKPFSVDELVETLTRLLLPDPADRQLALW